MLPIFPKTTTVGADWNGGYLKEDLVDVAEDEADWNTDVMAAIRSLKTSVNNFVNSAGQW